MSHLFQRRQLASLLIFSLLMSSIPLPLKAEEPSLVIGEIHWAGSSLSSADEWLEVWNLTHEPIILNGYQLTGASGNRNMIFGISDVIPAWSTFLISNYDAGDTKSILNITPDMVTSSVSLPNDKLKIQLLDPQGSIIDQAGNGLTPFAGSNDENKASMTRMSPLLSGDQPGAWFTATSSQNFDIGIFTYGTPGWCDGCQDKTTQNLVTSTSPTASAATTTQFEPTMTQSSPTSTATSISVIEAQESSTTMPIVIDYGPQHPVASFSVAGEFQ
ncbi:MAG: lamin tail domain-containing protein, partial [Candidatus Uhrbacteria bacterium]|nr:lamin tail domain-containing protein [Candidatus Uhrbacteria bacterium]